MSRVEYWELSSASANTVAAILISTLSMTTEIFSETLDNSQYSTRLTPESRRFADWLIYECVSCFRSLYIRLFKDYASIKSKNPLTTLKYP
jgi:hypothetical protein